MDTSKNIKKINLASYVFKALGVSLIFASLIILLVVLGPIFKHEVIYLLSDKSTVVINTKDEGPKDKKTIVPVDTTFGIVVPKIKANSSIIANVDPFDSRAYQSALTHGVAHAKGSEMPGMGGNIFLFSHSSTDFLTAVRYNSIFYLLSKLEKGDKVHIFYKESEFIYEVEEKKTVDKENVQYISSQGSNSETLTLMTCWPPGTDLKRLIVVAKRIS